MEEENTNNRLEHIYINGPITGTSGLYGTFEKAERISRKWIFCDQSGEVSKSSEDATWEEYIKYH